MTASAPAGGRFEVASRFRPFALVSPGFEQERRGGVAADGLVLSEASPVVPFCAVEVAVADVGGGLRVGLADGKGRFVLATYLPPGQVAVRVRREGGTVAVKRRRIRLPERFRFAFVLCGNHVTALADTGQGWRPLLTVRKGLGHWVDLRDPAELSGLRFAWGGAGLGGPAVLESVAAGPFGMAGLRDLKLVQHPDGTPVSRDGRLFLTATCAGMGFFPQAHWGVFAMDPADPASLTQTAHLFFRRDGLLLGDHAGQLVRDGDRWLFAVSSWGDFDGAGVHVRHGVAGTDLLHGVHVLGSEPLALPTTAASWDPGMTRIDGRWYVSFVESPSQKPFRFHPALAATERPDWSVGLRLVGADTSQRLCEGPVLARMDGDWRLLASDGRGREYPVYDLQMRRVGSLPARYGTNIPHPQLVPVAGGAWLLVGFDGTAFGEDVLGYGTHGDVVVMRRR